MAKAKMAAAPEPAKKTVTVLRTCGPNGEAHGGFKWPLEVGAVVECPDWQPTSECGHGLHGLLDGQGDWNLLDWSLEAKALVLEVDEDSIVEIGAKVKFPRAVIREVTTLTRAICNIACDSARIVEITKAAGKDADSGHYAQLAASGDCAKLAASGDSAICMATNNTCVARTGAQGALAIAWYDGTRPRIAVGYVGEGLDADTWYRVDDAGAFVRVEATA